LSWAAPDPAPLIISVPRYHLCGLLQLLAFLGLVVVATSVMVQGFLWIAAGPGLLDVYVRSATYAGATFTGACLLSILAKWTLIGRWTPRQIPVWSLAYLRFWLVKTLIRTNPLVRFVGTPLYSLYLRALGAKIGKGAVILSAVVPVCTDLLTVGSGSVIRKDSSFSGYRAVRGVIQIGPVELGQDVHVGEMTVLDIGTSMGDGARSDTPRHCMPGSRCRPESAGTGRRPSPRRSTAGRSAPPRSVSCDASCCPCCSWSSCSGSPCRWPPGP
jgi:non-ribosomal peptide synthetase-like protein